MATSRAALCAGWLALVLLCGWRGYFSRVFALAAVWLASGAGIAPYFPVHAEARFVDAFVVVCRCALFVEVRAAEPSRSQRLVTGVLVVISVAMAVPVVHVSVEASFDRVSRRRHVQWDVCVGLKSMGVAAGERMAVIGDPTVANYWAHCGEWSVVADVQPEAAQEFRSADEVTRARIYSELRGLE
jgi:hypothetical protein